MNSVKGPLWLILIFNSDIFHFFLYSQEHEYDCYVSMWDVNVQLFIVHLAIKWFLFSCLLFIVLGTLFFFSLNRNIIDELHLEIIGAFYESFTTILFHGFFTLICVVRHRFLGLIWMLNSEYMYIEYWYMPYMYITVENDVIFGMIDFYHSSKFEMFFGRKTSSMVSRTTSA